MSVTINIKGTPIEFPSTGESPNWAPAVIEFAQAVEEALVTAAGPYDIGQQVYSLITDGTTDVITDLNFPSTAVRAAFIKYSVFRTSTLSTVVETGNILAVFDGSDWNLTSRDYVGDAQCTFNIDASGQVSITTTAIGGINYSGKVSFSAQALEQT
jgi:hypothetical protein